MVTLLDDIIFSSKRDYPAHKIYNYPFLYFIWKKIYKFFTIFKKYIYI